MLDFTKSTDYNKIMDDIKEAIAENIINYRIAPQLIGEADIDGVTVKLTTTLPKGLEYVAGSSNYREPDITNDSNGTTTLVWEIYDCSVGSL